MLKVKTGLRFGGLLLGAFLFVSLVGPAFAGNVYSWVTEDGTHAFTDDPKRIPAMHRAEATRRPMGKLTRYERFTEVSAEASGPYAERLRARLDQLRGWPRATSEGVVVGAMASQAEGIGYTIPVAGGAGQGGRSGTSLWVDVDEPADADFEPTVIESKRMKPTNSLATRHWTFIKKGDQIVTVIKGELRQRPLKALSESDFDL